MNAVRRAWTKHGEAITTAICAVFVTIGYLAARNGGSTALSTGFFLVGYVAGGYRQAIEGTTKLFIERELDVDLLMVVAAVGAAAIGYWFDGALLIFIFALSGTLESYASARTQRDIEALMSLNPQEATVLRDAGEERLSTAALSTPAFSPPLLSIKTVESYRARLNEKMNLRSGTELVRFAVRWAEERKR